MSVNTVPRFVEQPKTWAVEIGAASPAASADGTGTTHVLVTAGDHGSKIETLRFQSENAAAAARLFLFLETSNNTFHLFADLSVTATSGPGESGDSFSVELTPTKPIQLQSLWKLRVGTTHTSDIFNCFASGGDY